MRGASEAGDETEQKARSIFGFARYVEWNGRRFPSPESPFVIGVYGTDTISGTLRELAGNSRIKGRAVIIQHLTAREQLRGCHILFISNSESERLRPVLSEVRREGVLTVGECDDFLSAGGVINFVNNGDRIGYEVHTGHAREQRLKLRGQLLQYASRPQRKSAGTSASRMGLSATSATKDDEGEE